MSLENLNTDLNKQEKSPEYGSTIKRIRNFNVVEASKIKDVIDEYHLDSPYLILDQNDLMMIRQPNRVRLEAMALSSMFITEIWKNISDSIENNPPGLLKPSEDEVGQIATVEDLKSELSSAISNLEAVKVITNFTRKTIIKGVEDWKKHYEAKLIESKKEESGFSEMDLDESILKEEELKKIAAYERYKKIISLGMSNVLDQKTKRNTINVDGHILGGFATALNISKGIMSVLPEVYKKQYGNISKRALAELVDSSRSIVVSIAQTDIIIIKNIQLGLSKSEEEQDNFDPENFFISQNGNKLSLEIKSEVLDKIHAKIKEYRGDPLDQSMHLNKVRTGCPALFSKGQYGSNVINELYDWYADLYKKFIIPDIGKYNTGTDIVK